MRVKLVVLLAVLPFFLPRTAFSDDSTRVRSLFYEGNKYYSQEKFDKAITAYENILRLGYESGPLYYNLGNSYFKLGSLGKAILNYLRAERIMPKDADLRSNLSYGRSRIKGGIAVPRRRWLSRIFLNLTGSLSLDRAALFSSILYFIFSILLMLTITMKNLRRFFIHIDIIVFFILILSASILVGQFCRIAATERAVITAQMAHSKFEPFDDATTFFTLHEGEDVAVITAKDGWIKVRRVDGKQGWIKKADLEIL